ncbi:MAG: hypothetical protein NT154_20305 [Verrucomicrobia bacterium]|nr:hypothetical protein [Verrucomicrobiota bacterium]
MLHSYRHPVIHQVYELRYLPVAAMVLLAASFATLWLLERNRPAEPSYGEGGGYGRMAG